MHGNRSVYYVELWKATKYWKDYNNWSQCSWCRWSCKHSCLHWMDLGLMSDFLEMISMVPSVPSSLHQKWYITLIIKPTTTPERQHVLYLKYLLNIYVFLSTAQPLVTISICQYQCVQWKGKGILSSAYMHVWHTTMDHVAEKATFVPFRNTCINENA